MGPFLAGLCSLHCSTAVWTQFALGLDSQGAGAAQPGAGGNVGDAITGLMDADVTLVAKHHLGAFFGVGLK